MKLMYLIMLLSKGVLPGDNLPEFKLEDTVDHPDTQIDYKKIIEEEDITFIFWGDFFLEERSEDTVQLLQNKK